MSITGPPPSVAIIGNDAARVNPVPKKNRGRMMRPRLINTQRVVAYQRFGPREPPPPPPPPPPPERSCASFTFSTRPSTS